MKVALTLLGIAIFLVPLVANLVGMGLAMAGAIADLLTQMRPPFVRLLVIGATICAVAISWSFGIIWVSIHTSPASGISQFWRAGLAIAFAVAPTVVLIRELPSGMGRADPSAQGIERLAVRIAATLNAVFVVGVLAWQHLDA